MKMKIFFGLFVIHVILAQSKVKPKSLIDDISEHKDLKKLLRTKNNVLVLYTSNTKGTQSVIKVLDEAAYAVKGEATAVLIDCSLSGESKKLCKKMKVPVDKGGYSLKHYKDGDFHKDYDRSINVSSMKNFLRDPTGDLPWEEDESSSNVLHLDAEGFLKVLKKEVRPLLVMFYAPWCGYCKKLKPHYENAANELKPDYVLAAVDVNRPENSKIRRAFNITGFPTTLYFENGFLKYTYEGENTKEGIVSFMKNPSAPPEKPKSEGFGKFPGSDSLITLTEDNFKSEIQKDNLLVMFYAPWCTHCTKLKPIFSESAKKVSDEGIGALAVVDVTVHGNLAQEYDIKGFPTLKLFQNGAVTADYKGKRTSDDVYEFMKSNALNKKDEL